MFIYIAGLLTVRDKHVFFLLKGEKKSCSLCPWNFWIVASGSADTFNEDISMFILYSVYLWTERRAVKGSFVPLTGVCSTLGRCPCTAWLGSGLCCHPVCDTSPRVLLAVQLLQHTQAPCASPCLHSWGWNGVQDQIHGQLGFKSHPLEWANTCPTSAVGWGTPCWENKTKQNTRGRRRVWSSTVQCFLAVK